MSLVRAQQGEPKRKAGQKTCFFVLLFSFGSSQGCALMQEAAEGGMTDVCRVLPKPMAFSHRGKLVWLACETLLIHDVAVIGTHNAIASTNSNTRCRWQTFRMAKLSTARPARRCERPAGEGDYNRHFNLTSYSVAF